MALTVNIIFDPAQETLAGNGWTLASWDDSLDTPTITTNNYATWTLLVAAAKALFQADAALVAYFQAKAETQTLAAHTGETTTNRTTLLTAEGL